ncbi:hypothetical protein FNF29_00316 [Cafeteria roenbergensis]|uniref:Uncharacterized protein n=1 Tax=Cafeteria roenbergensis TaxID=33653 RepID=A0A5A8CX33_CAFRO|nr:hypothetical protein FNF29_00316 [Cafeteria roenbergensis]|eukprot:KAA0157742.1 hypothetical protein FNF29_00316 [Cafeteria roenbergensis]
MVPVLTDSGQLWLLDGAAKRRVPSERLLHALGMADDLRLVSDDDLVHVPDGAALTDEGASLSLRALVGSATAVTSARPLSFAGGFDAGTHGSFSAWVWLWQAPQRGKRATVFSSSPTPPDGSALVVSVG